MGILDTFATPYQVKKKCKNCGKETLINIPKGTAIDDFISMGKAKCGFCGCTIREEKKE